MKKYLLITITISILLVGCLTKDMENRELGNPASPGKILIAGVMSEFKQQVIKRVTEKIGKDKYYIKITGLDNLKKEDTSMYSAIVLINVLMAGQLDGRIKNFLNADPDNDKVIIFTTTGGGINYKPPAVDSISSASKSELVEQKADELVELIRKRL